VLRSGVACVPAAFLPLHGLVDALVVADLPLFATARRLKSLEVDQVRVLAHKIDLLGLFLEVALHLSWVADQVLNDLNRTVDFDNLYVLLAGQASEVPRPSHDDRPCSYRALRHLLLCRCHNLPRNHIGRKHFQILEKVLLIALLQGANIVEQDFLFLGVFPEIRLQRLVAHDLFLEFDRLLVHNVFV
jgi:hypothetical protein